MTRRFSRMLPLLGVVILVVFSSAIVTAAVTTTSDTSYNGTQSDSDQAIEITYTVSPEGGTINNMTVNFDSTSQTFIQSNSFSFTVSPGGADINVESRQGNRFFIQEIEPNEEVTFVFEVYPKTIKQEEIDAASVQMDYIQNGQDLSDSETVTANMSSSPWFELQAAEETINQQESELQQVSLVGQITDIAFLGGIVIGLVGIGFGTYSWRRRKSERAELKREHAANLESLAERMEKTSDGKKLNNEAEDIRADLESSGDGGTSGDDW
ncbi:COG1361 family protein [Halorientalis persicus]|nr:hypothetical protein [Halorientalis persicus]